MNINSLCLHFYTKKFLYKEVSIQRSFHRNALIQLLTNPFNPHSHEFVSTGISDLCISTNGSFFTEKRAGAFLCTFVDFYIWTNLDFPCFRVLPDLLCRHLLRVHCGHNLEMDVYLRFPNIAAHLASSLCQPFSNWSHFIFIFISPTLLPLWLLLFCYLACPRCQMVFKRVSLVSQSMAGLDLKLVLLAI